MSIVRGQNTIIATTVWAVTSFIKLFIDAAVFGIILFSTLVAYFGPPEMFKNLHWIWTWFRASVRRDGLFTIGRNFFSAFDAACRLVAIYETPLLRLLYVAVVLTALILALTIVLFYRKGRSLKGEDFRRGSRLLSPREFNREFCALIRREVRSLRRDLPFREGRKISAKGFVGNPFTFSVGGIRIPEFALYRHLAVIGATGVGKSTLIKHYLDYCRSHGEKVIIPDLNGEYLSEFYRPGDVILSLYDKRSAGWSFSAENGVNPQEFAKFLVPSQDERSAFWWKGARQVLAHILETYQTPEALWTMISSKDDDFVANLEGLARKVAGKEGSPQAAGIVGSTILDLAFLRDLNYWPRKNAANDFSIFEWTQNDSPNWVFLVHADTDREATLPLMKLWLNTAILGLLKRTLAAKNRPLNIVIDELTSLGKIELLPLAIDRGRKYRGKIILGYQSEHQLQALYGRETGAAVKANTGTKVIYRVTEPAEARELSEFLGRQEIVRKQVGQSFDETLKHRENFSEQEALKNIVLDSEIRNLEDGEFYLRSLNVDPTRDHCRKRGAQQVAESHQAFHEYPPKIDTSQPSATGNASTTHTGLEVAFNP